MRYNPDYTYHGISSDEIRYTIDTANNHNFQIINSQGFYEQRMGKFSRKH